MDLFDIVKEKNLENNSPLAERMKPEKIEEFFGQEHIVSEGKLLRRIIALDNLPSMIFHGPPGSGKTSLAKIIAKTTNSIFEKLNAVTSGVKDIREVVSRAENELSMTGKKTILFIDEIHRFNKAQQDALLPYVEDGTLTLIGATTENPYYEVNNALISRTTVFMLNELKEEDILGILKRAVGDSQKGLGMMDIEVSEDDLMILSIKASGDARKALNALEIAAFSTKKINGKITLTKEILLESFYNPGIKYDKNADNHYDVASAFIKSIRGSDPDAALHYLARMIVGGEDIKFIGRRILISASEDIGNADPNAITVAFSAVKAAEMVGFPEARILLAQAVTYLASAPKSNSSYAALDSAIEDIKSGNIGKIPSYLKDSTANKLKARHSGEVSHSADYKYPHGYEGNYVKQQYLPDELISRKYYNPTENGYEKIIKSNLNNLKKGEK